MKNFFLNLYFGIKYKFKSYKPFLISTMGRSGTWYNREFFYFYNKLLDGENPTQIKKNMIDNKIKIKYLINLNYKMFSYNSVFIQHFLCPGFEKNYDGFYRKEWDKLVFYSDHIPAKFTKIMIDNKIEDKVSPYLNTNTRIIYYLRNPLDQLVAYFKAIQNHLDENLKYYYDVKTNRKKKFHDIHEFLREAGIDMYIKHYLSFKLIKEKFPNNILILYYENMVKKPEENFSKVLDFIGHKKKKNAFDEAIKLSSKESIIQLENAYGESISKAYKNKSDRQLKDAKIGKWQNQINNEDIDYIKKRFSEFNIDFNNFIYN